VLLPSAGVERAVRARRDQCHRESMSLYGDIFDLGDGESTLDPGLETGALRGHVSDGAARRQAVGGIGKIAITVQFAVGEVTTSRDSSP